MSQVMHGKLARRMPRPRRSIAPTRRLATVAAMAASFAAIQAADAQVAKPIDHAATTVRLDVEQATIAAVLADIERQTGNRVVDAREEFGEEVSEKTITLRMVDQPFWSVLDRVLDATNMAPYPYPEHGRLALVNRPVGALRRSGRAIYAGPFRIEATAVTARRGLRTPEESGVAVDLEISWEPRLQPVGLLQSAARLTAECDDGLELIVAAEEYAFDVEIPAGSHAAEVAVPLQLPARSAVAIRSLRGTMTALVPQQSAEFSFDNLADAEDASQSIGGLTVTLNRVARNGAMWELHMRLAVDEGDDVMQAHRGWMFENATWLVDESGEQVEHAGFETTMQDSREAGFAYLFELPEGRKLEDYKWIYRTPAAIAELPVEFELNDVLLP